MFQVHQGFRVAVGSGLLMAVGLFLAGAVSAQVPPPPVVPAGTTPGNQPPYAACQPPSLGEYLLLVVSKTPEAQDRVRRSLPPSAPSTICNYLDDVVTRVGGFTTVDTANAWARYLSESAGLSAFVVRPAEEPANREVLPPSQTPSALVTPAPTVTAPATPMPTATTSFPQPTVTAPTSVASPATGANTVRNPFAFNPKPLGAGYAVLVNYFNRPELAVQVQQLLAQEIGLVSYGQRPYLLAIYTTDQTAANTVLQTLTDRGFWAMVVDGRRVTLLKQPIHRSQSKN